MAKFNVKNLTDGPKVLNALPVITLQAGEETADPVEISDDEATSAAVSGWFELETVKPAKGKNAE